MTESKPTIMRSLGRFVGEITKSVRSTPSNKKPTPHTREVGRSIEETQHQTDRGTVTVRRTTIEEVELTQPDADAPPADRPPPAG